jgi:trehalose 6-phosphate synthase/phosphatase
MRASLDIARLSRENSSATFETGPLQELRRQLESLSTLGSADALGDFGTNTAAAAAAAAAAMEAALDGGGGGRESSTRVERLLQERQRSMLRIKSTAALTDEDDETRSALSEEQSGEPPRARQRLIIAANRLPISAIRKPDGKWGLNQSAGGLVSALSGVGNNYEMLWVGWPGVFVEEGPERDALTQLLLRRGCLPIYLSRSEVDLYYNGYCNNILWPLFHYVPLSFESKLSETKNMGLQWEAYQEANELFARVILNAYQPGDAVWCHDYHLMLLPSRLKDEYPSMKVGWFLHTPFPSSEIYRMLPVREELLLSVLAADLIGFHTYDYARHFVSACSRILGFEGTPEGVEDNGDFTRVAAFPIGIDPGRFTQALETERVQAHIHELRQRFQGRKVMLGVDRLDMIKGIPQKLLGFEKFLSEHPEWRDRVLLVQIAVPTRTDVPEYQRLTSQVHEIVGRINGRFGTLGSVPIQHLDCSLAFTELCALYAVTDVCLVTSLRDGMNLVSYEFVACQSKNAGVLVLSEFAGAAQSLGAGALLVNPWNVNDMAAALEDALTMPEAERRERQRQNFTHITMHTAQAWADTFVSELNDTHVEAELRRKRIPPQLFPSRVVEPFTQARHRLIILGYNATLTLLTDNTKKQSRSGVLPMKPIKTTSRMHPVSQECLQRLCDDPTTTLCIFSGSERNRLSQAFAHLPKLWIAAENGCFIRPPLEGKHSALSTGGPGKWITMVETSNFDWIESVQLVFDYFCERTPRSYVETRETSLVWSYKYADPDFGRQQARDLLQHLWTGPISNAAVDVIQGAKSVEVRPIGVSKGAAIERIVSMMGERGSSSLIETEEVPMRDDEDGEGGGAKRTMPHAGAPTEPSEPSESLRAPRTVERRVVDFVMCCGHFLGRDEDIFEYIERCSNADASNGSLPPAPSKSAAKSKGTTGLGGRPADKNGKGAKEKAFNEKPFNERGGDANGDDGGDAGPTIVTTFGKHYTCTVGRKRSGAGYYVNDSDDIAELLVNLTNNLNDGKGRVELLQFDAESSLGSSRSLAELARQNSGQSMSRSASQHRLGRNPSVSNVSNISDTSSL